MRVPLPPVPQLFGDEELEDSLARFRNTLDVAAGISQRGAEMMADGRIEAARMANEKILQDQQRLFERITDSAGAVWDAFFIKGESVMESLGNLFKGFFATLGRTLFQDVAGLGAKALLGQKVGLGGTLLGGILGGGGASGAGAAGIPLAGAGTFGGLGISGVALGATAGIGAAAAAGIAWAKSQAHHEANTFVQKFQNPFHRSLELITGGSKTAGEKLTSINTLWEQFEANSRAFAEAGSDEAKVVQQAFESLQPLIDRIRTDLRAVEPMEGQTIVLNLDGRTVARLQIPHFYALIRNEGMILQPTPTR
jgi:hypothetical protein